MLQSDIPTELITGIIILHAEKVVTALSLKAFIVRLYREKNKAGFLKALSDQPEHITSGMSLLKNIMKSFNRDTFHEDVKQTLETHKADVIDLHQHLTESMEAIHHAIVQCMTVTLSELKRSNKTSAYFRSFDAVVGPWTKQLVGDLATLRRLLIYVFIMIITLHFTLGLCYSLYFLNLLFYDALAFHAYLETLVASNTTTATGAVKQHQSPWMLTNAANIIFSTAKRRCYNLTSPKSTASVPERQKEKRKQWVPDNMSPGLEELPKWDLHADILQEIEEELMRQEALSTRSRGRSVMERKLPRHLYRKGENARQKQPRHQPAQSSAPQPQPSLQPEGELNKTRQEHRRRVRGNAPMTVALSKPAVVDPKVESRDDADEIAAFLVSQPSDFLVSSDAGALLLEALLSSEAEIDFDTHYGLLAPSQVVVMRAYTDDMDDQILAELQPRFVVMFESNLDFVRRIEFNVAIGWVYRNSNPGIGKHKYPAGLRCEKESFEKLIKERGSMLVPIFEDKHAGKSDTVIKTISTRLAGGRKELSTVASQVIVDMREFRSTLLSLLHASGLLVIPATLTLGDYILTPDICVERKSIPDLVASFNSGRLYAQCELMSVHYKQPILLIESEENKAFSLETAAESAKSYAKPTDKYPAKKSTGPTDSDRAPPSVQSKFVLLMLHFPRVRIIWSSFPYGTADIFNDLKANA
ncbi:hypothetical protein F4604DRAFT_1821532 [Suillus subluteus]|nr:hypothetical protein F4604DRAFT_1821532 [Suillus subluteus]